MNPFESASLSPRAKTPVPCPLPYDLTWDDLWSVLSGLERVEDTGLQAYSSYEKQGLNGGPNSCILSLSYPSYADQIRAETVFIKCTTDDERMEARKYQ